MAKSQSDQFRPAYSAKIKFIEYLIIKLVGSYYRNVNKILIYSHQQKISYNFFMHG